MNEPISIVRTCLACEHLDISFGEAGYSEMTPGTEPRIECGRSHFDTYCGPISDDRLIEQAASCADFAVAKELAAEGAR